MRYLALVLLLVVGMVGGGCAAASSAAPEGAPRRATNIITREEIQATHYRDAYDMVQALRPQWLRKRGAQSIMNEGDNVVRVYVNGVRLGGPEELRQLVTTDIERAEFLNAASATQRWGTGHASGAIAIETRSGRS